MAEVEKERVKLAKKDRKEANELLVAVGKQDEARVRRLLGIGHNPDAAESATRPSGVREMKDGWSALVLALMQGNLVIARLLLVAGATVDVAMGEDGVKRIDVDKKGYIDAEHPSNSTSSIVTAVAFTFGSVLMARKAVELVLTFLVQIS